MNYLCPMRLPVWPLVSLALLASCSSGKLLTVDVPTDEGATQLIYRGKEDPKKLVAEVRLNANGYSIMLSPMLNGKLHGTVVSFHPNGKRNQTIEYVNGKQHGLFQKFDDQGVVLIEGTLIDGLKNGLWTMWFDETQMSEQCNYVNDVRNGNCTFWFIDGNFRAQETYVNGVLTERKEH